MSETTMLYRPGKTPNPEAWNLPVETRIVDSDHLDIAFDNGWFLHPSDFPAVTGEPKPESPFSLLDETAATIIETIPALTREELGELLKAEQSGKTRKGVIAALEKALEDQ